MERTGSGNRVYFVSCILAFFIWSTSFIATKLAYESFAPITLGAARFVIASLLLGILLVAKREFVKPSLKDLGLISLSGFLGITLYLTMENIGVKLTSASNATLIIASYPAITALLERILYRVKISGMKMAGIAIAMSGVYVLSSVQNSGGGSGQIAGNLILVATGVVWAFYNFSTRTIVNRYPALTLSFYQTLAGTIFFIPLTFFERASWQYPSGFSLGLLLYLGVFCSVLAYMLYNFGLRRLSSATSVALMNLVPIFGVFFSVLILGETVSLGQLAAGAVVIVGVLLSVFDPAGRKSACGANSDCRAMPS